MDYPNVQRQAIERIEHLLLRRPLSFKRFLRQLRASQ
jgi:hypothetical protein